MTFIPFTLSCKARDLGMALAAIAGMHRATPLLTDEPEAGDDYRTVTCPECRGEGTVMSTTWDSPWHEKSVPCGTCGGSGEIEERV